MRTQTLTWIACCVSWHLATLTTSAQTVGELDGKWREVARTANGEVKQTDLALLEVTNGKFRVIDGTGKNVESGTIETNSKVNPKLYTVHVEDGKKTESYFGIFKKEKDLLTTCVKTVPESPVPSAFESKAGSKDQLIVWRRVGPSELDGTWKLIGYSVKGVEDSEIVAQDYVIVRRDGLQSITKGGEEFSTNLFVVHTTKSPKEIDFYGTKSKTALTITGRGIYELDGKLLTVAIDSDEDSDVRPSNFEPSGKIKARYERIEK